MQKGEIELTQKDAENTPAGGVVVGKRDGQTMIYDDASLGGYFVGKLHKDGGIKMINKSTGQPLEVQGSEIIITAPAVNDPTKHNFNGKMMTNREILSKINSDGGGVSFADGGDIPAKIHTTEKEYKYGGKMVHDSDIAHSLGMNSTLKKGKQQFYSGGMTYDVDAIYNAVKKGKLRLKTKEVDTFPMKYPVYDKQYSETVKTDLRKPNGIMVRLESGEEVLIDGNHRMNNAYLKGRKTMKTYYVEDPKQIGKFVKKSKFELVGENKKASIMAKKDISSHYNELNDPFDDRKDSENWRKYALPYDTKFDIEFKKGGHLSKNKSLRQIAEMHNVSLVYINEELAKGLEVEKEHFSDFKERTRVAKDHLVENPNYYTLLSKAGLKNGGSFNYGGSVSKENEFAFNKKSDRLKSFYKTNNPSIDSLLMECQTFINELVEQQKKLVLKLSLDTNGIETPMSEFAIEQYEIGLIFKMVQSFNKYLKTTDILTDVTIKNVGLFEISATVIRDGKKYSFRTELIPAGGYNIQEFHYRYITKTDLPESKENSAIDNLKSKLSVFKKIKSLEDDINRNIKSISDLEKYIKQGYYGDDDDDKLYRVDLNKEAILYEQENIERYKKEIEKLKIKQNDLESVLISLNKLKNGGHILSHHRHSENLVKDAKSGNTPARDLNNYNDIMDLGADEAVGGDSGLAFADGGEIKDIEPYFERFNRIGLSGVDYVMKSQVNFMDFESDLYSAQRGIENKYVGYEKFPFHEFVKKYDYVTKKDYYYSNQEHKAEIDLLVEKLKKEGYTVLTKTYSFTKGASQGFNKNNKAINVFAFKLKSYANGGNVTAQRDKTYELKLDYKIGQTFEKDKLGGKYTCRILAMDFKVTENAEVNHNSYRIHYYDGESNSEQSSHYSFLKYLKKEPNNVRINVPYSIGGTIYYESSQSDKPMKLLNSTVNGFEVLYYGQRVGWFDYYFDKNQDDSNTSVDSKDAYSSVENYMNKVLSRLTDNSPSSLKKLNAFVEPSGEKIKVLVNYSVGQKFKLPIYGGYEDAEIVGIDLGFDKDKTYPNSERSIIHYKESDGRIRDRQLRYFIEEVKAQKPNEVEVFVKAKVKDDVLILHRYMGGSKLQITQVQGYVLKLNTLGVNLEYCVSDDCYREDNVYTSVEDFKESITKTNNKIDDADLDDLLEMVQSGNYAKGGAIALDPQKLQQANALLSNLGMKPINKFGQNEDEVGMVLIGRINEPYQTVTTPDGVTVEILVLNPRPTMRKSQLVQQTFIKNWNGKDWFMSTVKDKKGIKTTVYSGKMLNNIEFKLDESVPEYLLISDTANVTEAGFRNQFITANLKIKEIIKNGLDLAKESLTVDYNSLLSVTSNPNKSTPNAVPKIEKVTIKETKYDRASVIGRNASTISELQFIVRDYLGYSTKEDVDWIKFYVNDNTRGGYYINLNKGKKNTVANVNPETLNSSNFKRVIDANSYLAKNYDWTDFFEIATASKQTTKDNSVTAISINYDNATTAKSGGMALASSTSKLYSDLIGLYQNRSQNVTIQPIGNKLGVNPIEINIYSEDWQTILFKQPLEVALTSINRILYGLFPNLNFDKFVRATIAISQTPASTSVKPFDFSMTKIWIGNNPELSKRVQEYAFTNGFSWANGGEKKPLNTEQPCLVFSKYGNKEGFITYRRDRTSFDNVSKDHKEITEADIFGTQTPTSSPTPASTSVKPFDFSLTKIDVSNNPDLSQKVQKRAFELGWEWENGGGKTIDYDSFNYLYFTKTSISSGNTNSSFVKSPKREITEAEIFGNQTPVTASTSTTTVSKDNSVDLVELRYRKGVVDYVNQSRTGEELLQKFNTIEDYLLKNPNETISVYISAEVTDKTGKITATTINIDIGKNGLKPSNFSYDEMKELIQEKWFNGKLDFNEFFNKSKPNSAKPFDLSKTKIKVDGDRNLSKKIQEKAFELGWGWDFVNKNDVQSTGAYCLLFDENKQIDAYYTEVAFKEATDYREITVDELFGSQTSTSSGKFTEGEIGLFKKIDKLIKDNSFAEVTLPINLWSKGADTKLFDLVDDDTLEVFSFRSYEINLGGVSEDSGNGRTVEILEKYVDWKSLGSQTSLSNKEKVRFLALTSDSGGYKNVSNLTEIKDTIEGIFSANRGKDESIILFANGLNGSSFTINFGDNRTCETCYDTLTDGKQRIKDIILFYSDADKYDWSDFFEEEQTPSSTTVVPKKVENAVYDLDVAISKLEKASSVVVSDYNKDVYDQSLKFLYDTRATYELALKFTPESAFMYERLDIMKKLADIEKNIKKIEDMKKGGAFYMLAKILEKLQRGENWRLMEQTQDVITNQLPQSEIDIIIRSQKFKNWFGDWEKALVNDEYDNVSKALTNGIPSVYHHGARRKKYTYREVSNGVLYLAENISYALWFSQNATAQSEEGNYLTECFVNIKNPIDLTAFHVKMIDLGDLVRYIDAIYPMAKIYDFIPAQVALLIKANQPTNVMMWAWQLIRKYAKFVNHIKENTPYDGFLYYENNPSDEVLNPITGQMEENVTKAVAIFKSPQVKVVDAVLFDGGFDDWRFENGGKIKN